MLTRFRGPVYVNARRSLPFLVLALLLGSQPAHAYIGPGAGFAFAGSLVVLVGAILLALATILLWPFTYLIKMIRVGDPFKNALSKRIIIIGLDGMDPGLATKLMREGRLPNLEKLAAQGVFRPLDTSNPSMSPVAWSSFTTGVDPSRHGIYDFLTRDPCTYGPLLSSTDIRNAERVLNIGKYMIPLEKPKIKLLQKSQAFWKLLGERHVPSIIQRVPITFPPVPFRGLLLSGMCVPDLRGSQGTFSYFSTENKEGQAAFTGGEQTVLRRKGDVIRSRVVGPDNSMVKGGFRMTLPFTLTVAKDRKGARLEIEGCEPVDLALKTYSDWVQLPFKAGLGVTVSGIARFYLVSVEPEVNLYMTPIHIDPENPAMPISHPQVYSVYLAKKLGSFATLGLAEDTWALNERVIDEGAFYDQAMLYCKEREAMLWDAIQRTKKGLVTTVFDTTDRVQHMFYRYLDPSHPANAGKEATAHADAIPRVYAHMDGVIGQVMKEIEGTDTTLIVMSDHGFTNFRRGVNLNTWLRDQGYLVLKDGHTTSGDWFEHVDWSRTKAFSLGLTGLFINRKGREKSGIVGEGEEYIAFARELKAKLEALVDPESGVRCIRKAEIAVAVNDGPYRLDAPDILVGYEGGYRNSWECATGAVTPEVFKDNTKSWSGDHCVDPSIVPGVFFCNRPIREDAPHIMDIPYTCLEVFGVTPPKYMQGRMLFARPGEQAPFTGPFPPERLSQSGAAPGARIFPEGPAIAR